MDSFSLRSSEPFFWFTAFDTKQPDVGMDGCRRTGLLACRILPHSDGLLGTVDLDGLLEMIANECA